MLKRRRHTWQGGVVLALAGVATVALAPRHAAAQAALTVAKRAAINAGLGSVPPQVVRNTPAAAWSSFLDLGKSGQFAATAHLLDLTEVPVDEQKAVGREIAEKLYRVLERIGARKDMVTSDAPEGPRINGAPANYVIATRFQRPSISGEVWLRRTEDEQTHEMAWLFTRQTVSNVRIWYSVLVEGKRLEQSGRIDEGLGPAPVEVKRGTPRATLTGFLAAAREGRFGLAAYYLDLSGFPPGQQESEGRRLARRLMLVLLRSEWINPQKISNDPAGAPEEGVPPDEQRLSAIRVRGADVDITLARHVSSDGSFLWTFSAGTVAEIDRLYAAHGYGWIGDHLPTVFFSVSFAGLQLWQWAALLLVVFLGWGIARVVGHLVVVGSSAAARRTAVTWDDEVVRALDGPLGFILWGLVLAICSPLIGLSPLAQEIARRIWKVLILTGCGWLLFRALDGVTGRLKESAEQRNAVALGFIPILRKVGKILVFFFVVLAALDVIGVNVVAALAGLGLGGLAVAFAAQKTLENVFGALAIAADRPFKVGDFVLAGDVMGTVEDVGLRSTKIRTLQRTLVSMPNSAVVNGNVTNFAVRDRIFYNFTIGVVYGTTAAQLTYIIDEIRRLLLDDPRVYLDAQRTRFKGFGASSLDIEVFAWINTTDYTKYTEIAEDLNLRIMEIVERSGSSFAFPSQTLYLGRDPGLSAERAAEIGREIEQRRAAGQLVVPEPTEAQLEAARAERERSGSREQD
jgi:MscS family membrane protein